MSARVIVRIDTDLNDKVNNLAKAEGKTVSEVVRELLEEYVRNRDIASYIDDLWEQIGGKLRSRGIGAEEIDRAIRETRTR